MVTRNGTSHVEVVRAAARKRRTYVWWMLRRIIAEWRRRAKSRKELALLSAFELRDLALSRTDAMREARKPFWQA